MGRMSGTFCTCGAWDRLGYVRRRNPDVGLVRRFEGLIVHHVRQYTTFSNVHLALFPTYNMSFIETYPTQKPCATSPSSAPCDSPRPLYFPAALHLGSYQPPRLPSKYTPLAQTRPFVPSPPFRSWKSVPLSPYPHTPHQHTNPNPSRPIPLATRAPQKFS